MARFAIITGASRGIGAATALLLAKRGFRVVVNIAPARHRPRRWSRPSPRLAAKPCDQCRCHRARRRRRDGRGNQSAVGRDGRARAQRLDTLRRHLLRQVIGSNSAASWTANCAPLFCSRRPSCRNGFARLWSARLSERRAVASSARRDDYARRRQGGPGPIRALCRPGAGAAWDHRQSGRASHGGGIAGDQQLTPERMRELTEATPMGRLVRPDDVAKTVAFLASEESGFTTGHYLPVNGGIAMD